MTDSPLYPLAKVDPADTEVELNCTISHGVLRFIEENYGRQMMLDTVYETQMNVDYLHDVRHWVSHRYYHRLLAKAVEKTGNASLPLEAGGSFGSPEAYRLIGGFLAHFGSPGMLYKMIAKFNHLWTKHTDWQVDEVSNSSCVIRMRFLRGAQDRLNCQAIRGCLEAVPTVFGGLPPAKVAEEACACDGADACTYRITWLNRPVRLWSWVGLGVGVAGGIALCMGRGMSSVTGAVGLLFGVCGYAFGRNLDYESGLRESFHRNEETAATLLEAIEKSESLNAELQGKVAERTAELRQALDDLAASQQKALEAEREAAVGVLAAGMAHEMNSPINAIRLSVQAALEDVGTATPMARLLGTAERATGRCKRIVADLLSFSREPQQTMRQDLRDIVAASIAVFEAEDGHCIQITTNAPPRLPSVHLDRAQIQQALLNILNNASDAMEGEGQIDISLSREIDDIVLLVADSGPGMAEEVRQRLFDPFFTTKTAGKGTGLGMSITYHLVRRNGGTIEVESEVGGGTAFRIRFPVDPDNHTQEGATP